jgi:uncharacterized protein (DUF1501 family)
MNRRDFLKLGLLATGGFALPAAAAPRADFSPTGPRRGARGRDAPVAPSRALVLVELNGGNDGLNTIIPYADRRYAELRPRLAIARDSVLTLSDQLGLHPALEPLLPAWRDKELAIVLGVGYPEPNRSHFRSIEIWDTASRADETLTEGWLARLFARHPLPAGYAAHSAVFGRGEGPMSGPHMRNLVLHDPQRFLQAAGKLRELPAAAHNAALAHLLVVHNETHQAAGVMQERLRATAELTARFPATRLGRELEAAARLLVAHAPIAVIKVSHGSFDTHSQQRATHERLLKELAEALAAFRMALKQERLWDQTLVLTYSEFGRRVAENGGQGTDHGTAAPHFLLGGRVRGGFHGQQPSLARLADGDLVHHVDFRSLYATVARHWWGAGGEFLGRHEFPLLDCLA